MGHGVTFRDVVNRLMSKYREDVLDEVAEDVERCVEMRVWGVIVRRAAECAGVQRLYEDVYYDLNFRKCLEEVVKEVVRG